MSKQAIKLTGKLLETIKKRFKNFDRKKDKIVFIIDRGFIKKQVEKEIREMDKKNINQFLNNNK
jgi:vacuolar-type H+-ATPase subunit F/Vma7